MKQEPTSIWIDGDYLIFQFENGHEYDPNLSLTKNDWWIDSMRDKIWFTPSVEHRTKRCLEVWSEQVRF